MEQEHPGIDLIWQGEFVNTHSQWAKSPKKQSEGVRFC